MKTRAAVEQRPQHSCGDPPGHPALAPAQARQSALPEVSLGMRPSPDSPAPSLWASPAVSYTRRLLRLSPGVGAGAPGSRLAHSRGRGPERSHDSLSTPSPAGQCTAGPSCSPRAWSSGSSPQTPSSFVPRRLRGRRTGRCSVGGGDGGEGWFIQRAPRASVTTRMLGAD